MDTQLSEIGQRIIKFSNQYVTDSFHYDLKKLFIILI